MICKEDAQQHALYACDESDLGSCDMVAMDCCLGDQVVRGLKTVENGQKAFELQKEIRHGI